jgi:uncharacterized integral membrane protein
MSTQADDRSFLSTLTLGNWLSVGLAVLAIAFILQNRETVSLDLFFVSARLSLWVCLSLVFVVGWLSGRFWRRKPPA